MEDTCKGKNCWFYILIKELIGKENQETISDFSNCPFYQELIWTPDSVGSKVETAKTIKDCTNKRSLLFLLEDILPRMRGVQKTQEEMRNSSENAKEVFSNMLQLALKNGSAKFIEHKLIE